MGKRGKRKGVVTAGFLGGAYTINYPTGREGFFELPTERDSFFKFTVPVSFSLSKQTIFIDRIIGNFGFDNNFDLTQLLSELVFTSLRIGAMRPGVNVYILQK